MTSGGATRGIALFLGVFAILNVAGDLRFARANANVWWLDFSPLPIAVSRIVLLAIAAVLLVYALRPGLAFRIRRISQGMLFVAAAAAIVNAVRFYAALAKGTIRSTVPLPLSAIVAAALIAIAIGHDRAEHANGFAIAVSAIAAAAVFPLLQICFFGATDYRRPADVIVVFGARANADGTPSRALADRVRTACDLYRAGLAPRILMSGGPGEGATTEPRAMRILAERLGVPANAIVEDAAGLNTDATVRNTPRALPVRPARALVVSHFYHLPRIKMAYQRSGIDAFTVPSRDTVPFSMPFNIAREDLAFWWYYVRDLGTMRT